MESTEKNGGEALKESAVKTPLPKEGRVFDLPSGKKATILPGKGKHAIEAQKVSGENSEKYLPALMAQLVTIDGKGLVMEDFLEMELPDYMVVMTEVSNENFISAGKI
jgi:hypothetical protein